MIYQSPNDMQLEGISCHSSILAVSSSVLGGNNWYGELRVFTHQLDLETIGAVRLDYGSSTCLCLKEDLISVATDDGNVLLFKILNGIDLITTPAITFKEHDDLVTCLTSSSNNKLISGSWDETVRIWDCETGKRTQTLLFPSKILGVCALGDQNILACADGSNHVSIWDLRTNVPIVGKFFDNAPSCLTRSMGEEIKDNFLLMGCMDGSVLEWDIQSNLVQTIRKHEAPVRALAVCEKTRRLLSGSDDGVVFEAGKVHEDFIRGATWFKGRPITSSWDGSLKYVDI